MLAWVNKIDPRARVVTALLFAVVVVSIQSISILLAAFAVSVLVLLGSGLPWRTTLKRMAAMDGFIFAMLAILPFSVPGDTWFTLFGLQATWQGLWRAIEIALVANTVILMLLALVGSMESVTLGQALGKLKVPMVLVHLLLFTVRYIEVLKDEYQRLRQAMAARAFRAGNNWHTYRSVGYLFGMLLVRAMERSERVLDAMKCRGFTGQLPMLVQMRMQVMDWLFVGLMISVMLTLLYVEMFRVLV